MRWEGESSSGRLTLEPAPVPLGYVAAPDPPGGMLVLLHGKSGWVRVVLDPYGGSEAPATSSELPFLRDMWRLRTYPKRGTGPRPLTW